MVFFVVGADEVTGLHLIEACSGDVAMAIGMHMDTGGSAADVPNEEQTSQLHAATSLPSFSSQA